MVKYNFVNLYLYFVLILPFLNRIPFNRARELASKFKIMDILFPLFAEEPNMYLNLPADAAQHDSNEVLPAVSNKCNLSSPQLAFSHKNRSDEYHNASSSSPVGLPATWDRPYQLTPTSSHYDDHQPGQSKFLYFFIRFDKNSNSIYSFT